MPRARSQISAPVDVGNYVRLAWLGASIGTVAGALGSQLQHRRDPPGRLRSHQRRRNDEETADDDDS